MSAYGNAAVAQSVERRLGKAEVTGSIPVISFFISTGKYAECAYLLVFLYFRVCFIINYSVQFHNKIC